MKNNLSGGQTSYGHIAGILMNDSVIPRIPGDPGHAETFGFPVVYEVLHGFPFEDLIAIKTDHIDILIEKAKILQEKGVKLIATDCGLFGPFHSELKKHLKVPFIGSALDIVPLLQHILPDGQLVGILTGDTGMLKPAHLEASGIEPCSVKICGMEDSEEFKQVVIKKSCTLDIDNMRQGVMEAVQGLPRENLGAVVLECTNLISFRTDIQEMMKVPVYDLVSLIEFYCAGLRHKKFQSCYIL